MDSEPASAAVPLFNGDAALDHHLAQLDDLPSRPQRAPTPAPRPPSPSPPPPPIPPPRLGADDIERILSATMRAIPLPPTSTDDQHEQEAPPAPRPAMPMQALAALPAQDEARGHLAAGLACSTLKTRKKRTRDRDGEVHIHVKHTQWFAHVLLNYEPADPARGAGGLSSEALKSRAALSVYRHACLDAPEADTTDAAAGLRRVRYAEFGLQLVSCVPHPMPLNPDDQGIFCTFKHTTSQENAQAAAQIQAIVVNLFSLQDVEALSATEHAAGPQDPVTPDILSTSLERSLVKDAMTAALADLKRRAAGTFGASRTESRLRVCLPAICESACSIIRAAHSPHLLPFVMSMLTCEDAVGLEGAMLAQCIRACAVGRAAGAPAGAASGGDGGGDGAAPLAPPGAGGGGGDGAAARQAGAAASQAGRGDAETAAAEEGEGEVAPPGPAAAEADHVAARLALQAWEGAGHNGVDEQRAAAEAQGREQQRYWQMGEQAEAPPFEGFQDEPLEHSGFQEHQPDDDGLQLSPPLIARPAPQHHAPDYQGQGAVFDIARLDVQALQESEDWLF